jgi:hypothetical protein
MVHFVGLDVSVKERRERAQVLRSRLCRYRPSRDTGRGTERAARGVNGSARGAAGDQPRVKSNGCRESKARKSGSHLTPRWSKGDSNRRSPGIVDF